MSATNDLLKAIFPLRSLVSALINILGVPTSHRNKLINGNFDIWQRGTSFNANGYSADRWYFNTNALTLDRISSSVGDNSTFRARLTATNAANSFTLTQALEAATVNSLKGKKVTFSFWAKASGGVIGFGAQKHTTADQVSAGSWNLLGSGTIASDGTFAKYSATFDVPDDGTANGVRVYFTGANIPNGATLEINRCQLEEGSFATPFEQRSPAVELALCQRYYAKTFPQEIAPAQNAGTANALAFIAPIAAQTFVYTWKLPVTMRKSPTVTTFNPTAANANWTSNPSSPIASVRVAGTEAIAIDAATNTAAGNIFYLHASADAEL
jgi:hypothetical protein